MVHPEKKKFVTARRSKSKHSSVNGQNFLISLLLISALDCNSVPVKRFRWWFLAFSTRFLISLLDSPAFKFDSWSGVSSGQYTCMSIRSSSAPDTFFWYLIICPGIHEHFLVGLPKFPQGQEFAAAIKINFAGYVTWP